MTGVQTCALPIYGEVARGIQHGAAALGAGLQATGPASNLAEATGGMEIWKTLRVFHIPTPSAATTDKLQTRRYTNNLLGTKDRSGHSRLPHMPRLRRYRW